MKWFVCLIAIVVSDNVVGQPIKKYDVVISEIMADPTPVVGLPNAEYIEIRNRSATSIDVFGWKLSDESGTATIGVHFLLLPDSLLVLCSNSNVPLLSPFGKTIGLSSFPSLDNDGDLLFLRSSSYQLIHAVNYNLEWYKVESKKQGGWSLEMIDANNPCSGNENWKASISSSGGTPAHINSVAGLHADESAPILQRSYSTDSVTVMLVFNETVDSISAADLVSYSAAGLIIIKARAIPPLYFTIELKLSSPLVREKVYLFNVSKLQDCKGNAIGSTQETKAGLASSPNERDIAVNEILFNPVSAGYDYVELFNSSNKIIDLAGLQIANRDINGQISSVKKIISEIFYLFPGDYLAVTEDRMNLSIHYLVKNMAAVVAISQLPSYPDDEGSVLLLDVQGNILDEVNYSDEWHFALIANKEGIALEKIDPKGSSNKDNWHSAASTAGYGTPGYQNSQYKQSDIANAAITMSPKIFSPDNDGYDDLLTISYQLDEQGFVGRITIFDMKGRQVKALVKNDLLAFKGRWTWDGLDEKKEKLPIGTYVILTEIFNLQGKRKIFKETVVLARRE